MCQIPRNLDRGSGSVLALGLIVSFLTFTTLLVNVSQGLVAQARLDAVADSAAIAGADALRGLVAGYPCEVTRELGVSVSTCQQIGDDVLLEVTDGVRTSKSRAGSPN